MNRNLNNAQNPDILTFADERNGITTSLQKKIMLAGSNGLGYNSQADPKYSWTSDTDHLKEHLKAMDSKTGARTLADEVLDLLDSLSTDPRYQLPQHLQPEKSKENNGRLYTYSKHYS
ncbi:MAG: hypothetical protein ACI8Y7_000430 [Candidatus Woesearchaeota archaeon]|jgi:hypothetical protein